MAQKQNFSKYQVLQKGTLAIYDKGYNLPADRAK